MEEGGPGQSSRSAPVLDLKIYHLRSIKRRHVYTKQTAPTRSAPVLDLKTWIFKK